MWYMHWTEKHLRLFGNIKHLFENEESVFSDLAVEMGDIYFFEPMMGISMLLTQRQESFNGKMKVLIG